MSDLIISGIRTGVPLLVAAIVGFFAAHGIDVPPDVQLQLAGVLAFAAGMTWYLLVRWAEKRWKWAGILLGVPRKPQYVKGEVLSRRDEPLR